jgi:hypothetical protein
MPYGELSDSAVDRIIKIIIGAILFAGAVYATYWQQYWLALALVGVVAGGIAAAFKPLLSIVCFCVALLCFCFAAITWYA